jgi:hypothetical protein
VCVCVCVCVCEHKFIWLRFERAWASCGDTDERTLFNLGVVYTSQHRRDIVFSISAKEIVSE